MRYSFKMNGCHVSHGTQPLAWELYFFNGFIPLDMFFVKVSIKPPSLERASGNHRQDPLLPKALRSESKMCSHGELCPGRL